MALLAGVGPMGLGAIDYAIHCDRKPGLLVVTDIDEDRLERAAQIYTVEEAWANGVELVYANTADPDHGDDYLRSLSPQGNGFNDVFVFAPVQALVEQADRLLAHDGCLNFFAGPTNPEFTASFNFFNVHYAATHVVGTSGGNTADMIESLKMMEEGLVNPATMVTHVGGLDAVIDTTLQLPDIAGGKKLIYNNVRMPLVALSELQRQPGDFYRSLAEIVKKYNGLWSPEAERFVLAEAPAI
jgi:threonine dehydrogenase-like Zn-dependent dehydrogenase